MSEDLRPTTPEELKELIAWAAAEEAALEILGAGSKRALGRPVEAERRVHLAGLAGITLYEPAELVMAARAGTPLAEIEERLAASQQQLAFEPPDYGLLLGGAAKGGTIGGAFACNLAGPRRIKAGAARDHLLGVQAATGRGELIKSGGRVVKNVTGYDLCKLLTGSFGTLAVMSEVTFKVLPAPPETATLLLDRAAARARLGRASPGAGQPLRGRRRRPSAGGRGGALGGDPGRDRRRRRHRAPPRGAGALGALSRRRR